MEHIDWQASIEVRLSSETDPILYNESSSTHVVLEFNVQTVKRWLDYRHNIRTREVNEPAISRFTRLDFTAAYDELKRLLVEELDTYGMENGYQKAQLVDEGIHFVWAIGRRGFKSVVVFQITKNVYYVTRESLSQPRVFRGRGVMTPARMDAISSLPTMRKEGGDVVECCSVCLEELPMGVVVSTLPCSHIFHNDCISKWLNKSHYCPLCRFSMPIE